MANGKILPVIKKNGRVQRSDVSLTNNILGAVRNHLLSGKKLYSQNPPITYKVMTEENKEEERKLSINTIKDWIRRNVACPDNGIIFKDFVNRCLEEYRTRKSEERQKTLTELAEREILYIHNLKASEVVRKLYPVYEENEDGKMVQIGWKMGLVLDEQGRPIRKVNPKILAVKQKSSEFVLERLKAEKYGKIDRGEIKHLVFSLSDLRKAKEEIENENSNQKRNNKVDSDSNSNSSSF